MRTSRSPAALAAALSLCCAAQAHALGAPSVAPPSQQPPPQPPMQPQPPASPAPGSIQLVVQHAFGRPAFVISGREMVLRGIVAPFVTGQQVEVSIYRDGREVAVKRASVLALGHGAGQFHVGYRSATAGTVWMRGTHFATPEQVAFSARSRPVEV